MEGVIILARQLAIFLGALWKIPEKFLNFLSRPRSRRKLPCVAVEFSLSQPCSQSVDEQFPRGHLFSVPFIQRLYNFS